MGDHGQTSIGALWTDMGKQSETPTAEERRACAEKSRQRLPPVRHRVRMRFERLFGVWRVTLSIGGATLRECQYENDHPLEEMVRRGRGITCLADRQAFELGMRRGMGMITLSLDADQLAKLDSPQ